MLLLQEPVDLSPRPVLSVLKHEQNETFVVRDDLLPGGTKQRAAGPYVRDMIRKGYKRFVYASPFSGFAQVALASVCQSLKVECIIVCERDQRRSDYAFHPFSLTAREYGAKLIMTEDLAEAEAQTLLLQDEKTLKIPLGFDCPIFRNYLALEFRKALKHIEHRCGPIRTMWMPVGSGTLVRTLLTVLPKEARLKCVNVRILTQEDPRLKAVLADPRVELFEAPVPFRDAAPEPPAIPSNLFYDAKLWSFIKQHGQTGDVWWNVAR